LRNADRPTQSFPPTHTQGLLPFLHAPAAYLVVPLDHGSTGVFHNTSLDLNYWQSTLLKLRSLYTFPFFHDFLHIFRHTSLPRNVPLSARELKFSALFSDNPFSSLSLVHNRQTYANYFCQRNKHPCCLSEKMCSFYEGGEDQKGLDNKQFTALVSPHKFLFNFYLCNC
jgi:hypothetical protein